MEIKRNSFLKKYNSSSSFSLLKCITNFKQSKKYFIPLNIINLLLSISCIGIYIYLTYQPNEILKNNSFFMFNFVCRILFLLDFIGDIIMMSIEKNFYLIELLLDFLSIFPFLIMRFIVGMKFDLINNTDMIFTSFICFRINRIIKFSPFFKSDVNRELYNIVCSMISLLLVSSTLINVIENTQTIGKYWLFLERDCFDSLNCEGTNDSFHTTLFFVMTTLATIGYYSSITSVLGRVLIILLIVVQVAWIPTMCGNLMTQITSKSVYARTSYNDIENVDFILISGNISMGSIDVLLQEYFHPDHGGNEKHALVLMPNQPDPFMKKLMQRYQNKLFYFEGDCLKFNDLERCMFHKAKMIMLLCNKQSDDSSAEDAKTIIQAMVIKKYMQQIKENTKKNNTSSLTQFSGMNKGLLINKITSSPTIDNADSSLDNRLIIQLMRPESEHHFELSIAKNSSKDQILCIDQLKLSLLAKSCLCQGIISLLSNLITTNNMVGENKTVNQIMKQNPWMDDYTKGKDYEIYKISLDFLRGINFTEIVHRIYKKSQTVLFALNIESKKTKNSIVLLSPTGFILPVNDNTISIYGYILSTDQNQANKVLYTLQNDKHLMKQVNNHPQSEIADFIFSNNQSKRSEDDEEASELIDTDRKEASISDKFLLAQSYHVTSEQILKENAICTSLQNKLFVKKGHIIICGICQNLLDFIKPLRAKHIAKGDCPTIVILSNELPDDKVWSSMAYFDELFIIQGDPMNKKDLLRAGIATASKVVILAPSIGEISNFTNKKQEKSEGFARKLTREEGDLLDAKTIFKYNLISKIRKDIYCVIELINPKNISFLNNKNRKNSDEYVFINAGMDISLTASFASGEIYYSNMMDNLITQTYYNPNLLGVLKKLIIGGKEDSIKKRELKNFLNVPSGNLYLIDMPNLDNLGIYTYSQLSFGVIFEKLLQKKKMIVIGVYKYYSANERVTDKDRENELIHQSEKKIASFVSKDSSKNLINVNQNSDDTTFYYVVTSPDRDFKLNLKDKLFVISSTYPSIDANGNIQMNEEAKIDGLNVFQNDKNFGVNDKYKKKEIRELKKEIDLEGERKLRKLNETMNNFKDIIKEVKASIQTLNKDSKDKISESIQSTIEAILKENKLSNGYTS